MLISTLFVFSYILEYRSYKRRKIMGEISYTYLRCIDRLLEIIFPWIWRIDLNADVWSTEFRINQTQLNIITIKIIQSKIETLKPIPVPELLWWMESWSLKNIIHAFERKMAHWANFELTWFQWFYSENPFHIN